MVPALKSRAKLTRSLPRPGKRWLHYFFKDHKFVGHFGIRQQYLAHRKLTSFLYSGGFTLNDLYCSASSENVIFSASIVFSPLVSRSLRSLRRSFSALDSLSATRLTFRFFPVESVNVTLAVQRV